MFLNTESHDLHSIDEHERSVIQINETEFLVQKIEMQVFFRQKEIYFNSDPGAHASKITRWETCYISSISRKVNSFFLKTSR